MRLNKAGSPHRSEISTRRHVLFILRRTECGFPPNSQPARRLAGKRRRDWNVESTHSGIDPPCGVRARCLPTPSHNVLRRSRSGPDIPTDIGQLGRPYPAGAPAGSRESGGSLSLPIRGPGPPYIGDLTLPGLAWRPTHRVGGRPRSALCIYRRFWRMSGFRPISIRDAQNCSIADLATSAAILRKRGLFGRRVEKSDPPGRRSASYDILAILRLLHRGARILARPSVRWPIGSIWRARAQYSARRSRKASCGNRDAPISPIAPSQRDLPPGRYSTASGPAMFIS